MISVVCPIYNEEKYISKCIDSILQQDYPKNDMEILFVDGMSRDNSRSIINTYIDKYPFIKLLDNPFKIVPYAMNIGIKNAKGDVIIRLDAHAEYPTNYFSRLVECLDTFDNAENVGGVCITLPCNDKSISIAISEALSCSFGMGNSYFRTGSKKVRSVDTVPFGCFRKNIFERIGYYDNDLVRNQDDEFNGRIKKNGGKIYLIPDLKIKYYARDKVRKVWNMFYQYGLYKPLVNKKLGSPATVRQFFPLLFVLGLIFGAVLGMFSNILLFIYLLVIAFYTSIGLFLGFKRAKKHKRFSLVFIMPCIFYVIHIGYGWGYIHGIYKNIMNKSLNVKTNR